jgi:hypothetical protein
VCGVTKRQHIYQEWTTSAYIFLAASYGLQRELMATKYILPPFLITLLTDTDSVVAENHGLIWTQTARVWMTRGGIVYSWAVHEYIRPSVLG